MQKRKMWRNRKRLLGGILLVLMLAGLTGCTGLSAQDQKEGGKVKVITTLFPYYDFIREIGGDKVDLTLIVPAGMDTHSFEPTASDMVKIGEADLFIYNGGTMEAWVPKVLEASSEKKITARCMMDYVDVVQEELVEGMEQEEHEDAHSHEGESGEMEYDEHIWTSPVNAQKIVEEIRKALSEVDPENSQEYDKNVKEYIEKLQVLDQEIKETVNSGVRKELIFGDRFPLRYFTDEYGLAYRAAFPGCSADTEPSADTIAYLIDQVKQDKIPVVLTIELSSVKVAETIAESTGAQVMTFYSCHNVTKKQFDEGISYLEMMEENIEVLKKALA